MNVQELDNKIKLGMEVEDLSSGLKGIVDAKTYSMYGSLRVSVQPRGDGSELKSGWIIDAVSVKVINDKPIIEVREPSEDESPIKLGDKVRCTVTGFEGIAINRVVYLNGCVHFTIQEKYKKDGMVQQEPPTFKQSEKALIKIEMPQEEKPRPVDRKTGGPAEPNRTEKFNPLNWLK